MREVRMLKVLLCLLFPFFAALLFGCASTSPSPKDIFRGFIEATVPDASLATLELGDANWVLVNGVRVERSRYGALMLWPGEHKIEIGWVTGVSFMVNPRMVVEHKAIRIFKADAGRTYRIKADRTSGAGYTVYFWIEDASTRTVVSGTPKR